MKKILCLVLLVLVVSMPLTVLAESAGDNLVTSDYQQMSGPSPDPDPFSPS